MAKHRGQRGITKAAARAADAAAEAKDTETTTRTPELTMAMPAPDRLLHYFDAIEQENTLISRAKKRLEKIKGAARAENVSVSAIAAAQRLAKGDLVRWRQHYEQLAVLAKEKGNPFQIQIFDVMFKTALEQAVFEATAAARAGRPAECKFAEGTPEFDAYMETYARVQASMVPGASSLTDSQISDALDKTQQEKVLEPLDG